MNPLATLSTARTLPFSPDAIHGAFAAPERLARWWGPKGFSNHFETFEFWPGGRWIFTMQGPDGTRYANECRFEVLEPGRRVVIRHVCAPLFTLTVTLQAVEGGTILRWDQTFEDAATAQAVAARVGDANEQNLDRLTEVLQALSSGQRS